MTFRFIITPSLAKLAHRDKVLAIAVRKKIVQVTDGEGIFLDHLKNLRADLKAYKRTHVGSLMFKIEGDTLIFDRFRHHDDAY